MISQREIREYKNQVDRRLLLDRESAKMKKEEEKVKASLLKRLIEEKETCATGKWIPKVSYSVFPRWKAELIDRLGEDVADEIKEKTKPTPVLKIVEWQETIITS